jgi:hypothetical protein
MGDRGNKPWPCDGTLGKGEEGSTKRPATRRGGRWGTATNGGKNGIESFSAANGDAANTDGVTAGMLIAGGTIGNGIEIGGGTNDGPCPWPWLLVADCGCEWDDGGGNDNVIVKPPWHW